MRIRCDCCPTELEVADDAAAKAAGWYTHQMSTFHHSFKDLGKIDPLDYVAQAQTPTTVSVGYICPGCAPVRRM